MRSLHAAPPSHHPAPPRARGIDRLRARFRPDLPFGLGTSAPRIAAALRAHGLEARIVHSGWTGRDPHRPLAALRRQLERGDPVVVCLDDGLLGGRPWSAHWAVVLGIGDARVRLGNAGRREMPLDLFLRAWRCRHLPYGHHHCAVIAMRPALLSGVSPVHLVGLAGATSMTAVAIIGLTYRARRKRYRLSWDSLGILAIYAIVVTLLRRG